MATQGIELILAVDDIGRTEQQEDIVISDMGHVAI
jgi:hypothetical protein